MKKLLVLFVVLALVNVANAGFVGLSFTVGGVEQGPEVTITPVPSGNIELDLELLVGHNMFGYDITYTLSNANAELITSGILFPAVFELPSTIVGDPLPQYVRLTGSQLFGNALNGPQEIMKGLVVHCLAKGDVMLTVASMGSTIDGEDVPEGTILHTLLIHQPEPATLIMLGLGSLFLARRKK